VADLFVICKMASSHVTMEHPLCSSPSKLAVVMKSVADIKGELFLLISFAIALLCMLIYFIYE